MINDRKILVVGDLTLDETIIVEAVGISLETPTLKTKFKSKELTLGAAANVCENIAHLKKECIFLTVLGEDDYTEQINSLKFENLSFEYLKVSERINNVKTRFWIKKENNTYKYLQVNRTPEKNVNEKTSKELLKRFNAILDNNLIETVVIVDYRTGVLSNETIVKMIDICNQSCIDVIASSQLSDSKDIKRYECFVNADVFVCNDFEMQSITECGLDKRYDKDICVTMGSSGCVYTSKTKNIKIKSPAISIKTIDTCGAGDAFLASFVVNLHETIERNLSTSNFWAGVSTLQIGTKKAEYSLYEEFKNELK